MNSLVIGIASAVATMFAAWIASKRLQSGKIGTSEAGQLWAKTTEIEKLLTAQVSARDARILVLEQRVADLEDKVFTYMSENMTLKVEVARLTRHGDTG